MIVMLTTTAVIILVDALMFVLINPSVILFGLISHAVPISPWRQALIMRRWFVVIRGGRLRVWGLGFRVWGLGSRVLGFGFGI